MKNKIINLVEEFNENQEILIAIGDETRQYIIIQMMLSCQNRECQKGLRVNEIAKMTNLSRTATSQHLQILKKAGLICMTKEGTKNYYYFNNNYKRIEEIIKMFETVKAIMMSLPKRRENDGD